MVRVRLKFDHWLAGVILADLADVAFNMGVEPKIGAFTLKTFPKSFIFIGISIIKFVHFGVSLFFGYTHIYI